MGDVGADVLVGQQQLLDAVEQPIEGARKSRKIVVGWRQRDAATPMTRHNPLGGAPHGVDPPQELRAEPKATRDSERDRRPDRPTESGHDAAQRVVRAAHFVADDQDRSIG